MAANPLDFSDLEPEEWKNNASLEEINAIDGDFPTASQNVNAIYDENCYKCRGSGNFVSYSGRIVGKCFRCKGTGKLQFKTSKETRQRNRKRAQERKVERAQAATNHAEKFLADNPELKAWFDKNRDWDFCSSLYQSLVKYGSLTEKQLAAAKKCAAKYAARQAERAQERKAQQSDIDLSDLPSGRYAVPGGDTRLKVLVRHAEKGKWAGYCFVSDDAAYGRRENYGRQAPGELYSGKIQDQLRAILADPFEASKAYGKLVGACGVCGRRLEDEQSIAAGIGPVCASKF